MPTRAKQSMGHKGWANGLGLGAMVAVLGLVLAMTPFGRWLEEDLGLSTLFKLRGPLPAPEQAVVVSIDQDSARALNLSSKPRLWPRALHGELVTALKARGAAAIFFDVIFEEQRDPQHNQQFAKAMQAANNVILFQYLKREILPINGTGSNRPSEAHIERLVSPIPVLADNAFGLAAFPLPKVPAQVNHFVLYLNKLGDSPTMPVVMLQMYALPVYEDLLALLHKHVPNQLGGIPSTLAQLQDQARVHEVVRRLHVLFVDNPDLGNELLQDLEGGTPGLPANERKMLIALIEAYAAPDSAYLNFYGPPRSIHTLSYHQVLDAEGEEKHLDLAGKAVFVGYSSRLQPEQQDGFYTVFTDRRSGLDISGVEIGATAFGNLLRGERIRAPAAWIDIVVLIAWGTLLGVVLRFVPGAFQIPAALVAAALYALLCYARFAASFVWLPLAVPLLWQLPLASAGTMLWKYLEVQRERRNIRRAFGYHLPVQVVDQLAKGVHPISADAQQVHGIVLATDAAQYTALSEQLAAPQLRRLMNRYYEVLFLPIREAGGIVSDVVGDAALAIWAAPQSNPEQRHQACLAAIEARRAIEQFNKHNNPHPLPTRMGLHCGDVVLGHVGAVDHFEYRAVGDIVNTATRIEGLNKRLGTRIIASQPVVSQLRGIRYRNLGRFILAGKTQPLTLYELIDADGGSEATADPDFARFHCALDAFQQSRWAEAVHEFRAFLERHREDGPCRYYLNLCQEYDAQPPDDWDGVIRVPDK